MATPERRGAGSYVDYDSVARTYQSGRGDLAEAESCMRAIASYLPQRDGGMRVLDLGAGTGIFARIWPDWGATEVVALDPSLPMLYEARRVGMPRQTVLANGAGEALPLRNASVDVAWLSTMLHHLTSPDACVHELRRVLTAGGVVLIRNFFADASEVGWFGVFPGVAKGIERFPSLSTTTDRFDQVGFAPLGVERLVRPQRSAADAIAWARKMRNADTILGALNDGEFAAGLAELGHLGDTMVSLATLHIAAFVATP